MPNIFQDFAKNFGEKIEGARASNVEKGIWGGGAGRGTLAGSAYGAGRDAWKGANDTQRLLGGAALGAGALAAGAVGVSAADNHPVLGVMGTAALVGIAGFRPGLASTLEKDSARALATRTQTTGARSADAAMSQLSLNFEEGAAKGAATKPQVAVPTSLHENANIDAHTTNPSSPHIPEQVKGQADLSRERTAEDGLGIAGIEAHRPVGQAAPGTPGIHTAMDRKRALDEAAAPKKPSVWPSSSASGTAMDRERSMEDIAQEEADRSMERIKAGIEKSKNPVRKPRNNSIGGTLAALRDDSEERTTRMARHIDNLS